jgi:hypothetical protein
MRCSAINATTGTPSAHRMMYLMFDLLGKFAAATTSPPRFEIRPMPVRV